MMAVTKPAEGRVKLWTHHPSEFTVDDPNLVIDQRQGRYWKDCGRGFRYSEMLSKLCSRIGTDQFLWCCTARGQFIRMSACIDLVEWEINVPESQIVAFYRESVWETIVHGQSDDWDVLIIGSSDGITGAGDRIGALVRAPLRTEWATCHGPLPVEYP